MTIFLFYFLAFFIYSVLGWIIEVIFVFTFTKKLLNRGFLIGPYCPIYGVAALSMHFLLIEFIKYPILIFILAALLVVTIEFITSYTLEKIFKTRWWDYSQLPFNIEGRVCLIHAILFGILGLGFIYILDPKIMHTLTNLTLAQLTNFAIIALVIFIIDLFISFKVIKKITTTAEAIKKDNTAEINEKMKEILLSQSYLTKRIILNFPNLKTIISHTKKRIKRTHKQIKEKINDYQKNSQK